jgi:hypothetical protein
MDESSGQQQTNFFLKQKFSATFSWKVVFSGCDIEISSLQYITIVILSLRRQHLLRMWTYPPSYLAQPQEAVNVWR